MFKNQQFEKTDGDYKVREMYFYFNNSSIGRVVVKENQRKYGYGHQLVKVSIEAIKKYFKVDDITISAQLYLKKFYEFHDFKKIGEQYLEDGIPHIRMDRN